LTPAQEPSVPDVVDAGEIVIDGMDERGDGLVDVEHWWIEPRRGWNGHAGEQNGKRIVCSWTDRASQR
jgi:hypothetical protein